MKRLFIGIGVAAVLVGGSVTLAVRAHTAPPAIELTIADQGRTVTAHPGDLLVVRLGSKPVLTSPGAALANEFAPWASPYTEAGGVLTAVENPQGEHTSLPIVVGSFRAERAGQATIVAARSPRCVDPEPCAGYPDFVVRIVVSG
jgi:hypothetical protein